MKLNKTTGFLMAFLIGSVLLVVANALVSDSRIETDKFRSTSNSDTDWAYECRSDWENGSGKCVYGWYSEGQKLGYQTCHNMSRDGSDVQMHCSWETLDDRDNLNTHFAITVGTNYTHGQNNYAGLDHTRVNFPGSLVQMYNFQPLVWGSDFDYRMHLNDNAGTPVVELERDGSARFRIRNNNTQSTFIARADDDGNIYLGSETANTVKIMYGGSSKFNIGAGGELTAANLTGTGNDYVCVNSAGELYRDNVGCT